MIYLSSSQPVIRFSEAQAESSLMKVYVNRNMLEQLL